MTDQPSISDLQAEAEHEETLHDVAAGDDAQHIVDQLRELLSTDAIAEVALSVKNDEDGIKKLQDLIGKTRRLLGIPEVTPAEMAAFMEKAWESSMGDLSPEDQAIARLYLGKTRVQFPDGGSIPVVPEAQS